MPGTFLVGWWRSSGSLLFFIRLFDFLGLFAPYVCGFKIRAKKHTRHLFLIMAKSRSRCLCQDGTFQTSASTRLLSIAPCFYLQDGKWINEDEEAQINRGTSKPGA